MWLRSGTLSESELRLALPDSLHPGMSRPADWRRFAFQQVSAIESPALTERLARIGKDGRSRMALIRHEDRDFSLCLQPLLLAGDWRLQGSGQSLSEAGNGLKVQARWWKHWSLDMDFRDASLEGPLADRWHPGYQRDRDWLWAQVDPAGSSLTHDETRASLRYRRPMGERGDLGVLIGREQPVWGSALLTGLLLRGDQAPPMNLFQIDAGGTRLRARFLLAELESRLIDSLRIQEDPVRSRKPWREKWLAGHRLELSLGAWEFAFSELLILGDEKPGLGVLNPVNFYWSEQHAAGDRDNTLLFFDVSRSLPQWLPGRGRIYGELGVDDYTLGDFGSQAEGQKTAMLAGLAWSPKGLAPGNPWLEGWTGTLEMRRIRPWYGSHFYLANVYSHGEQPLAGARPNSRMLDWEIARSQLLPAIGPRKGLRLGVSDLRLSWRGGHHLHGRNPAGENIGGELMLGHREGIDPTEVPLLAGELETRDLRRWTLEWRLPFQWVGASGSRSLGLLGAEASFSRWGLHDRRSSRRDLVREFRLLYGIGF